MCNVRTKLLFQAFHSKSTLTFKMIETAATVTTREERSNLAHPGYSGAKNWLNSSMSGHCCVQCKVSQLSWKANLVEKRHLFHIARESRMFLACHTISSRNTYTAAGTVEKEFLVSINVYLYFALTHISKKSCFAKLQS